MWKNLVDGNEPVIDEKDFELKDPKAWEEKLKEDLVPEDEPIEKTSMFQSDMDAHIYSFDNNF